MAEITNSDRANQTPELKDLPEGFEGLRVGVVKRAAGMCQSCTTATPNS